MSHEIFLSRFFRIGADRREGPAGGRGIIGAPDRTPGAPHTATRSTTASGSPGYQRGRSLSKVIKGRRRDGGAVPGSEYHAHDMVVS